MVLLSVFFVKCLFYNSIKMKNIENVFQNEKQRLISDPLFFFVSKKSAA